MVTLTEFLLARIAEDDEMVRPSVEAGSAWFQIDSWPRGLGWEHDGLVIDPARVLAECEAKRRIVEELQQSQASLDSRSPRNPPVSAAIDGHIHAQRRVVRWLALPFADHADYQPE